MTDRASRPHRRGTATGHRPGRRLVPVVVGVVLLALLMSGCLAASTDEHNAPGVNITTETGLDIADLRVASFQAAPYPEGSDVQVLARMVTEGPDDRLLSVASAASEGAELIGENGDRVDGLTVPSDGVLALTPDGPHILLTGLRQLLREGDSIPLTLVFERAGEIRADIQRRVDNDGQYTRSP